MSGRLLIRERLRVPARNLCHSRGDPAGRKRRLTSLARGLPPQTRGSRYRRWGEEIQLILGGVNRTILHHKKRIVVLHTNKVRCLQMATTLLQTWTYEIFQKWLTERKVKVHPCHAQQRVKLFPRHSRSNARLRFRVETSFFRKKR